MDRWTIFVIVLAVATLAAYMREIARLLAWLRRSWDRRAPDPPRLAGAARLSLPVEGALPRLLALAFRDLGSADPRRIERACLLIEAWPGPEATGQLVALLSSADPELRRRSCRLLYRIGDETVMEAVYTYLRRETESPAESLELVPEDVARAA